MLISCGTIPKEVIEMKKIVLLILSMLFLISGCNKKTNQTDQEKLEMYQSYYNIVRDNTLFQTSSKYFSLSFEVTKNSDGTYLYYVSIDNAQIAMYDIEIIVLEGKRDYDATSMTPSFGIFDDEEYNMIPYQANAEKKYVKGITVSGDLLDNNTHLYMMVCYKDITKLTTTREFIEINLNEESVNP